MNPTLTLGQSPQPEVDDEFSGGRAPLPVEQLEERARHLAAGHGVTSRGGPRKELLDRLDQNAHRLEQIYKELSASGFAEKAETASEEWLRDNHYVVRAQVLEIRRNLPRQYYQELPTLTSGKWKRYPRVYLFSRDFVTHTAGRFDQELLRRFAEAYQDVTPLTIGELWAIPMMVRLALLENLCGLAVQTLRAKQEREEARKFSADLLNASGKRTALQLAAKASATFVVEILHTLRDQSVASTAAWRWLQTRLTAQGQTADELLRIEQHREAIDQLSIANIIGTMRVLSALDWPLFVESVSRVERILRRDPAGAYADMDRGTRDRYRKSVEQLSKRSRTDELTVAERAVHLAQNAVRETPEADRAHHVGYYLISRGRFELEPSVGYRPTLPERFARLAFRHPALGYLGILGVTSALFEASLLAYANNNGAGWPMLIGVLLLTFLPVGELAVSFINSILTTIIRPRPLPKLQLREGVPDELRTVVAVPSMLSSADRIRELVGGLEVRALANLEDNLSFALLSDFSDAESEVLPSDEGLLSLARELIEGLNERYGSDRFFLFHRKRVWNPSEQRWMGWERKRGKLHEFNRLLRGATDTSFLLQVGNLERLQGMRFVITLDSDTDLPLDMGRKLVGTLGHPLNKARFDPSTGSVTEGYSLLQPRVAINAVSAASTTFSQVFSGHVGIDPYTTAVSDVYQDLFHEGSYVGKGIYDIDAFEQALEGRVPENALLSHDLFEGIFARIALCTDLDLIDDFPAHYLTWATRLHRWVRGDWQLLPWLGRHIPTASGGRTRNTLPAIARWKIADNLRRSLLAPALVLLLLAGWLFLPGGPGIWTGTAFFVLFFPAYVQWGQTFTNRVQGVPIRDHIRAERNNLAASFQQVLLTSAFLAHQSFLMIDAIGRTLVRLARRRRLLEWEAAADAAARLKSERRQVFNRMWMAPVIAITLGFLVLAVKPMSLAWAILPLLLWATSPLLAYETGLKRPRTSALDQSDRQELRRTARLTWRFFEEMIGPGDNWLVPDNHQEGRRDPIAHRTSPTNIGLQLLAAVSAWDLGYISASDCLTRLERTLDSMVNLARYRGHLFNWYDTQTLLPLAPLYVSTVDSGNLLGYLLTLKIAMPELVKERPSIDSRFQQGLADTVSIFEREGVPVVAVRGREASRDLRADLRRLRSRLTDPPPEAGAQDAWLRGVSDDLALIAARLHDAREKAPTPDPKAGSAEWWLDAAASMVTSRRRELTALAKGGEGWLQSQQERVEKLARFCDEFFDQTELEFLFDQQRHLFAIGYNVTEGRRDQTFYDALASEARLSSFVGIATRHVSQEHWFKLGRLMTPVGQRRALVSWSASMFEYLMPLLIMRTYERTLLDETYEAVIERQIDYGRSRSVPWGISESAYNVQDAGGNYQYRAFGVPGLGLKRGLADDLVIAPYASLLAAPLRPREVVRNLEHLASEGALGPMGYYESIDYTLERLESGQRRAVVKTVMAHHHAMSLIALNNCLNDRIMQARFHAEPRVQSAELLLQERSPQLVPVDTPPEEHRVHETRERVLESTVRRYVTPHTVSPRAQLLSNGSYSVMVTNAGGGYSRWRDHAVTRWREDLTTDEWGAFCFVRDVETGQYWSSGFQPSGREAEAYEVTFAPDRAVLRRRDADLETFTEVTVSPEDDAEIRRVSVTNHSRRIREIELTSYAEVVLAPPAADLAHPAFSNLFVETSAIPEYDAILCTRRPRGREPRLYLGHVLTGARRMGNPIEFETNRELFIGRGGTLREPAALVYASPLTGATGAVLDPIVSLRVRVKVPPAVSVRVSFTTVVAENEDGVRALVEKYHDPQVISRAFALASTHSDIELRHRGMSRSQEAQYQRLAARIVYADPRLRSAEAIARNASTPADLWKYGISGDLPIVLVTIADGGEVGLVQELVRAQEYLRAKNFAFDLVILNEIPTSYRQDVQDELQRIAESSGSQAWIDRPGGLYIRRADALTETDRVMLRAVARAVLEGSRGGLEVQLKRPLLPPVPPPGLDVNEIPQLLSSAITAISGRRPNPPGALSYFNGFGGFTADGRAYQIESKPPAPWSNVVASPRFGFVATDSGLGTTWSVNSYQNRLTPWRNDPVTDPPGEVIYIRDDVTGEFWSATPSPAGPAEVERSSIFGQGFVTYEHAHRGLEVELTAFVPLGDPIKVLRLRIDNTTAAARQLSLIYFAEWCLGDQRARSWTHIVTHVDSVTDALFARNPFRPDYGGRVAFVDTSAAGRTLTGDRTGFIGRNGTLASPAALRQAYLSGRTGARLDPCGAAHGKITVSARSRVEMVFTLGEGEDEAEARALVSKYRRLDTVEAELKAVHEFWNSGLAHLEVKTPDQPFDIMVNRWLEYQTLSCRYFARSAFYQSGGAYGFRDQLQDVIALLNFDPRIAREHVLRAASHQFLEGDVQHWWHEPGGEGVRTRIQDDRLWLVYATFEYIAKTGDRAILDEPVTFIEQRAPGPDEGAVYERPTRLSTSASLYDHCARAITRTLDTGGHGLPLMGTGDWNDGMDEVGARGQGESVWLAWFLASLLPRIAAEAESRGDVDQANTYRAHSARLIQAVEAAWDGEWYRRAYFDDGTPLGSESNRECRIDSLTQSWAVIAGLGDRERARRAMDAVDKWLVDRSNELILLLTPPFDTAEPHPGYIRGYVPGVRENGGQYTHAAIWVVMARALLGDGDAAFELLKFINPIGRSSDQQRALRYRVEPYAVAADIYSASDHAGRGGWTWYTGAAGWMYRVATEYILGIRLQGGLLTIDPCIPKTWSHFTAVLRLDGAEYTIDVDNPDGVSRGVRILEMDGRINGTESVPLARDSGTHRVRVVLGAS